MLLQFYVSYDEIYEQLRRKTSQWSTPLINEEIATNSMNMDVRRRGGPLDKRLQVTRWKRITIERLKLKRRSKAIKSTTKTTHIKEKTTDNPVRQQSNIRIEVLLLQPSTGSWAYIKRVSTSLQLVLQTRTFAIICQIKACTKSQKY